MRNFVRTMGLALAAVLVAATALAQKEQALTQPAGAGPCAEALAGLFAPATAAVDADGAVLLTRRAVGHPAVADLDGDGKADILLGCHRNMDTAAAEILLLRNVGPAGEPRFGWPATQAVTLDEGAMAFSASCGCKSGGAFEVHPIDWNGDGAVDLVVDTFWTEGVRLFVNVGKDPGATVFRKADMLFKISGHGSGSGGGDWTGDGVMDLVFPVNSYGWAVYPGTRDGKATTFATKAALTSKDFKPVGQERWFTHSPYAWNFSGKHGPGSDIVEIAAVIEDPDNAKKPYNQHLCHINYYWLDRNAKTVTLQGTLATIPAACVRMSMGDLNGDGAMDLLATGGVFTKGQDTQIWILYGKVKNIAPAKPAP